MRHFYRLDYSDGQYSLMPIGDYPNEATQAEIDEVVSWGHAIVEMDDEEFARWDKHITEAALWQNKWRAIDNASWAERHQKECKAPGTGCEGGCW